MIKITAGKYEFLAKLEEKKAPKTCEAFRKMLPYTNKLYHCRWCGEAVWTPIEEQINLENENHTTYPSKGEILFYPGGAIGGEFLLPYGSCAFMSKVGGLAGNHFLSIENNLEDLEELGKELLEHGTCMITFEEC
jgi:hypothetical protein